MISLAAACYVMSDIFMKFLSSEISMFQITFLRGLLVTFFLFSFCYMSEASFFIKEWRDRIVITIRSILEVIMTYAFLVALFNMNVANANAILQLIPLIVLLVRINKYIPKDREDKFFPSQIQTCFDFHISLYL